MSLEIYTDGGCMPNPGIGGWAAVFLENQKRIKTISGNTKQTTNSRMELTAVIEALFTLKTSTSLSVYSDSQYVLSGIADWSVKWVKNNWNLNKSGTKKVKNIDLWEQLVLLNEMHEIEWYWVKAHSGDVENEFVDSLATEEIQKVIRSSGNKVRFY